MSVGLALCLTAVFCGGAYAEEPASNVQKTAVAARSLELDRSTYTDGSVYDNASPEHDVVKVGVAYNTSAVDYAELTNVSGGGFDIGNCPRGSVRRLLAHSYRRLVRRPDTGAERRGILRRRSRADKRRIQSHIR